MFASKALIHGISGITVRRRSQAFFDSIRQLQIFASLYVRGRVGSIIRDYRRDVAISPALSGKRSVPSMLILTAIALIFLACFAEPVRAQTLTAHHLHAVRDECS
jgi:hypothetical protein